MRMVRPTPNLNSKITLYLHFEQFGKKIELNKKKKKLYYRTEHHISVSSDSDRLSWISGCRASKNNKFNIQNVTYIIETTWHKSRSLVIKKFQNEPQKSEAWNTLRWWLTALNGQNKDSDPPLLIVMQK